MNEVNQGMVEIETEVCLALARFYDSPPPSRHDKIPQQYDSTPEECAQVDAPFREQSIQNGLQGDRT